jgi:hypothetical protein
MAGISKRMAEKATELFKADFKKIEENVPDCFRSNPGGAITPSRRKKALEIIERIERSKRSTQ